MNKGVANFYHYHAVARAANERTSTRSPWSMSLVPPPSNWTASADRPRFTRVGVAL